MAEGARSPTGLSNDNDAELTARYEAALARVPFRAGIYLPTDRVPLAQKAAGMERVAELHNGPVKTVYREQLQALRRKHAGQHRAFIIGNGPSLNQTDLSQLKDEVTFCVNGFFLKMPELDWSPTYYVVEDHLVAEDRAAAINALEGPTKLFPAYLGYCLEPGDDTIFFNHRARKRFPDAFDFSTDASDVTYTGCTVTFTCMQLAHYFGFQELYLIGVDATYDIPKDVAIDESHGSTAVLDMQSEDPNHFHPDYFGKGMRWHDPQVDKMLEAYGEARTVSDALGRPIYNATIGGALEVFERRSFQRVFPEAIPPDAMASANEAPDSQTRAIALAEARQAAIDTAMERFPRVLLLDVVPPGQMTATGELKKTLFGQWPDDRLMQVAMDRHRFVAIGGGITPGATETAAFTEDVLARLIDEFAPELLLFRPVPDRDAYNAFAFEVAEQTDSPLALWIVDDWPAHLKATDPQQWQRIGPRFEALVQRAAARLAISEGMATAFEERYGASFSAFSNAVDPRHWPEQASHPSEDAPFRIRYSGGLSSKMTLDSLLDLAQAVEDQPSSTDIRLEINTRDHWASKYGNRFSRFSRTVLSTEDMAANVYRSWLMDADMTAIVYNFDPVTIDYVRHSMANKTVECLASGAAPLVYGPSDVHTIGYLEAHGLGLRVDGQGATPVGAVISEAIADRAHLRSVGDAARRFALEHRRLDDEQERFRAVLAGAAKNLPQRPAEPPRRIIANQLNADYRVLASAFLDRDAETGTNLVVPVASRLSRILWFYTGWRGALAGLGAALPLIAILCHAVLSSWPTLFQSLIAASVSGAFAIVFFFIGYLFSLIEDYSPGGRPPA